MPFVFVRCLVCGGLVGDGRELTKTAKWATSKPATQRIPTAEDTKDYTTTTDFAKDLYQAEIFTRVSYINYVVNTNTELQTTDGIAGTDSWDY